MPHLPEEKLCAADAVVAQAVEGLHECCLHMDAAQRPMLMNWLIAAEGVRLWNDVGHAVSAGRKDTALANSLERWCRRYQQMWREVSRESELWRIREVCTWYAEQMR